MDKEKLLKKLTIKYILGNILTSTILFIWIYATESNMLNEKQFYIIGFVIIVVCLVMGFITQKLFGEKNEKEKLAIMPLIISIHDTIEKLTKQKKMLTVLYVIFFAVGFTFRSVSVIFIVMFATSHCLLFFGNLVGEKIKYLENKPEGMNF